MNRTVFISLGFFFFFLSASPQNADPSNHNNRRSAFEMILIELGEGDFLAQPGDEISLHLAVFSQNDSIVFNRNIHIYIHPDSSTDSLSDYILQLHQGDSASFYVHRSYVTDCGLLKEIISELPLSEYLRFEIRVSDITLSDEIANRQLLLDILKKDPFEAERDLINSYLSKYEFKISPETNGIYFIFHSPGEGSPVMKGRSVKVRYTGLFLSGEAFDRSAWGREGMTYNYGTQFYIVEGLNYALGRMREGSKALVLLPSSLAFGESGSAGGIVPPHTPVLYEVEVLKVN